MNRYKIQSLVFCIFILPQLSACGGGDSSSSDTGTSPVSYTVSTSAGSGGSISPTSKSVQSGQATTFTINANTGYSIENVSGCGGSLNGNTYTTSSITADCSISASFKVNQYTVTASADEGGTISPEATLVEHGTATAFEITTWDGHSIERVSGCGGNLNGRTYTTAAITSACAVSVSFSLNSYTVTAYAHSGGTITPETTTVSHGETATFQVVAANDHSISEVKGCNGALADSTYTTGAITESCEIDAFFFPIAIAMLNDTGVDWCANNDTNKLTCGVNIDTSGFEGQDGNHGRDALARGGLLAKLGGGRAGFDFIKIGANGGALEIQNAVWKQFDGNEADGTFWSCVQDNHTGLMWQVKSLRADFPLHNARSTFTWYNPDNTQNGGGAGVRGGGSCYIDDCDTYHYVKAVNSSKLCGYDDWRMPTPSELMGTIHNGDGYSGELDSLDYFPYQQIEGGSNWSSVSDASYSDGEYAVIVGAKIGIVDNDAKQFRYHVRLVRRWR
ncbi:DUF1566 domain-containing protein [Rheinheimera maricola]|uniref:DUF1566 domain-containing protein n=1 Tax=Rheinheimera maricola TaxID=2793282 RepID=A0ABS7XCV0_9GAMM|nr:DUF1566 domain-containing protein [Rheinheimera maricola]MBZ9613375.1 DUF1566 domain-containing protein [Rheinheimera maricola]